MSAVSNSPGTVCGRSRRRRLTMPALLLFAATLTAAATVHSRTSSGDARAPAADNRPVCAVAGPYTLLSLEEYESLSMMSRRVMGMMAEILPFYTEVWPHAVRDSRGRAGLIVVSSVPLEELATSTNQDSFKGWLVCAIVALGKYSAITGVPIQHVCFTDINGASEQRWCYDADMSLVCGLHRSLVTGSITADEAHAALVSHWRRIDPLP